MANKHQTTRKPRTDTMAPGRVALIGILFIVLITFLGYMATRVYNGIPGKAYQTLYVNTPTVGNLLNHDQVRISGARVGQVTGRDLNAEGQPRIKLQLEPGTVITKGTKASFRANGLLGARFVDIELGKSKEELPDGATITGGPEQYAFGVPEALGTFDEKSRGRLGDTLGGLGQGLLGRGEGLNDTIVHASEEALHFRELVDEILSRPGSAQRLLPALESAVGPLDRNRVALSEANGATAAAVTPFVTEREATRDTMSAAGPALRAVQPGLTKGTALVDVVDDLAVEANRTLPFAPAGFAGLRDLLRTEEPLVEAEKLVGSAQDAVPGLLRITASLRPVLDPARRTLRNLGPTFQQIGKYECDLRNFGTVMRSMTGFTQPGSGPGGPSQAFRLQAVAPISTDAFYLPDYAGLNRRTGVTDPCTFLSKPYPQFVPEALR